MLWVVASRVQIGTDAEVHMTESCPRVKHIDIQEIVKKLMKMLYPTDK
jgi:hypothetical protein